MSKLLISFENITKSFGKKLFDISKFDIYSGRCIIITGDNGSGKSTLLKIINGITGVSGGTISYMGKSYPMKQGHIISSKSVYLSSKPYLFDCSVEKNINYPLFIRNSFTNKAVVDKALDWAGILHLKKRSCDNLSNGEKQRVALARAYVINPNVWLLDEPTDSLDKDAKEKFYKLINKLLNKQHCVIIATHSLEVVQNIPSDMLSLKNKKLVETFA